MQLRILCWFWLSRWNSKLLALRGAAAPWRWRCPAPGRPRLHAAPRHPGYSSRCILGWCRSVPEAPSTRLGLPLWKLARHGRRGEGLALGMVMSERNVSSHSVKKPSNHRTKTKKKNCKSRNGHIRQYSYSKWFPLPSQTQSIGNGRWDLKSGLWHVVLHRAAWSRTTNSEGWTVRVVPTILLGPDFNFVGWNALSGPVESRQLDSILGELGQSSERCQVCIACRVFRQLDAGLRGLVVADPVAQELAVEGVRRRPLPSDFNPRRAQRLDYHVLRRLRGNWREKYWYCQKLIRCTCWSRAEYATNTCCKPQAPVWTMETNHVVSMPRV